MTPVTDGAWDPGAIAVDGQEEKHFTLALAKSVREKLSRYRCKVVLTRETDTALAAPYDLASELRNRANVGNKVQADLFISLHHDNIGKPRVRGGSQYVHTRLRTYKGKITRDYPPGQGSLAWVNALDHQPDGSPNHDAPRSLALAQVVSPHIEQALAAYGIPWKGILAADVQVLRDFDGPCLLLEAFYGSNPEDVAAARRPNFISDLAAAIAQGIAEALVLEPVETPEPPAVPEVYPATLVVNLVRYEGYEVVNDRTRGELWPLLDVLKRLGCAVDYDWRTRTLTVTEPMANVAASGGGPNLVQ